MLKKNMLGTSSTVCIEDQYRATNFTGMRNTYIRKTYTITMELCTVPDRV